MKPLAIVFMILLLTIVWGGFAALIAVALRKEREPKSE